MDQRSKSKPIRKLDLARLPTLPSLPASSRVVLKENSRALKVDTNLEATSSKMLQKVASVVNLKREKVEAVKLRAGESADLVFALNVKKVKISQANLQELVEGPKVAHSRLP